MKRFPEDFQKSPTSPVVEQISTAYTAWKSNTGNRMARELVIEPEKWGELRGLTTFDVADIKGRKFLGFLFGMKVYSDPTIKGWRFEK
jgi:hypothetical protein